MSDTELNSEIADLPMSDAEFYARGIARSRYHDKLFAQSRPRPTNEQFDEGWAAAMAFVRCNSRKDEE